ncbi:uncharacterized protein BDZ99DRAFT_127062 [Mytilinidion resinicola]|uniref:Uncharacterized protein n=1 Tax=Mytilinidion resinicola TaxID=574789 RepID=A0A6A6Z5S3_9PEZI|nr:uncharacterized protein BDZ99DRAFT_127062 [Mytilinidion resinicola]KAF2816013.1 hypothetical protein BDZ99DRAFT_127062 [Mytilinidion resinicola]
MPTLVWALIRYGQSKHADPKACRERIASDRGFKGLPDFYGLGIRVGLYLQWDASIIANTWVRSERRTTTGANVAFFLALYVAILAIIFQDGCVFTTELITLMYILWGGFFIVILPHFPFRFKEAGQTEGVEQQRMEPKPEQSTNKFHGLEYLLGYLFALFSPATIWFWIRLATVGEHDFAPSPLGTEFFLFARLGQHSVRGAAIFMTVIMFWMWTPLPCALILGLRNAMKGSISDRFIMATMVFMPPGLVFGIYTLLFDKLLSLIFPCLRPLSEEQMTRAGMDTRYPYRYGSYLFYKDNFKCRFFGIACSLMFIYVVLAIELTLKWNSVSDVYEVQSTGQVTPLAVGLLTLFALLWKLYRENEDKLKEYVRRGRPWTDWAMHSKSKPSARRFHTDDIVRDSPQRPDTPEPEPQPSRPVSPDPDDRIVVEDMEHGRYTIAVRNLPVQNAPQPVGPMTELEPVPISSTEPSIISEDN